MGTLVDFRAWLRLDLNDPAGASQRFADGDLDRAVTRAVAELTAAWPKETDTEHAATAVRIQTLAAGTYPGLLDVSEIEQPYGAAGVNATNPPSLVPFRLVSSLGSVRLLGRDVPAAGDVLRIRWTAAHAITAGATTVPVDLDALLILGALGHASRAYSSPAADNFRYEDGEVVGAVDDSMVAREWRLRGDGYLQEFRAELRRLRERRARTGRPWSTWGRNPQAPDWPTTHVEGLREP